MAKQNEQRKQEVILYHGSLVELNSRDPRNQYKIVGRSYINSGIPFTNNENFVNSVGEDLRREKENWIGLINLRTVPHETLGSNRIMMHIEGTPIAKA